MPPRRCRPSSQTAYVLSLPPLLLHSHQLHTQTRFSTWRALWLNLAIAEKELGLPIPDAAIAEMRANLLLDEAQMQAAAQEEKKRRHDVMAHVHVFGSVCPTAAPFIQ